MTPLNLLLNAKRDMSGGIAQVGKAQDRLEHPYGPEGKKYSDSHTRERPERHGSDKPLLSLLIIILKLPNMGHFEDHKN